MKILLTAVNAKYIHSNLAIHCLKAYAKKYEDHIELAEYTINNYTDYILQEIYKKKPDIIAFSCYIWNIDMIEEVASELRKVLPEIKIWFGGPEVSFDANERLLRTSYIDGIMIGEGEETFKEILDYYIEDLIPLKAVKGIAFKPSAYKEDQNKEDQNKEAQNKEALVFITEVRQPMDLSLVPFPYEKIEEFKNKIIYYETSRGCPYSCSYCLSSIDKHVRIRDLELVKRELAIFLEIKIPQVKFVDRTFNCNRRHSLEIWRFIKEHDNGITNFHFEISADILNEEELNLLASMREGLVQLEIGIQSTNERTIEAINRKMSFEKLSKVVKQINEAGNIHQHLDLIAGLPYEDYESFRKSFNDVYALEPEQFQLGFLKVLKGSEMYYYSKGNTITYKGKAPYEVLYTKWLSYGEVLRLKAVEEMVEVYYNSGQFTNTIKYLQHFFKTPFDMFKSLSDYYEAHDLYSLSHSRISRYHILLEYFGCELKEQVKAFEEILVFDLYLRENIKSRPSFATDSNSYKEICRNFYESEQLVRNYLVGYEDYNSKQISRLTHIERFTIDFIETISTGVVIYKDLFVLFDYKNRNPLNYQAKTQMFEGENFQKLIQEAKENSTQRNK